MSVKRKLLEGMDPHYTSIFLNFSAQTQANQTQGIIDGKLEGSVHADECTWCIAEKGAELQIMLVATSGNRWVSLMDGSD